MPELSTKKRIFLVANTDWYLWNFRLAFAKKLQAEFEFSFVGPEGDFAQKLRQEGFAYYSLDFSKGKNPFLEIKTIFALWRLYQKQRPDLVHHFTVKAVLYGSLAAKLLPGIKIVNSITGLGHVFLNPGLSLLRLGLKTFYLLFLKDKKTPFLFQNPQDLALFSKESWLFPEQCHLIEGSGIDTDYFSFLPHRAQGTVLFIGRLLKEKGVREFLFAAQKLRQYRFVLVGDLYEGNPSSLTKEEIKAFSQYADFRGFTPDIRKVYEEAEILVLPSYREGMPRVLLEAGARGVPFITSDVPGCREASNHGDCGVLVPKEDVMQLTMAIEQLMNDKERQENLRKKARAFVEKQFSLDFVAQKSLAIYRSRF